MVSAYIIQANSIFRFIKRPTINKAVTIITDGFKPLRFYMKISSLKAEETANPLPSWNPHKEATFKELTALDLIKIRLVKLTS